jgi:hypothetical protein
VNSILPLNGSFLDAIQPTEIGGPPNLTEKKMLLAALRFYFGPAQWWNEVKIGVKDKKAMEKLNDELRKPGGRYDILEQEKGLGPAYFDDDHKHTDQVELFATKRDDADLPRYFLYEASKNLTFYVGRPTSPRPEGWDVKVINAVVLDDKHKPLSSHTLDFGFLDSEPHVESPVDGPFLDALKPEDVDGKLIYREKDMLLTALRFYFGPAQQLWKAVVKNETTGIDEGLLNRYRILEEQTGLGKGYFDDPHKDTDQVKLYAATNKREIKDNLLRLPSYFLYEASKNLTLYVGPDLLHGRPSIKVINTLVLDDKYKPVSSHTLDFGVIP